jgi:hypothetical protein
MEVTVFEREKTGSDGKPTKIVTWRYDCQKCGMTVRSEDIEATEGQGDSEAEKIEQQESMIIPIDPRTSLDQDGGSDERQQMGTR